MGACHSKKDVETIQVLPVELHENEMFRSPLAGSYTDFPLNFSPTSDYAIVLQNDESVITQQHQPEDRSILEFQLRMDEERSREACSQAATRLSLEEDVDALQAMIDELEQSRHLASPLQNLPLRFNSDSMLLPPIVEERPSAQSELKYAVRVAKERLLHRRAEIKSAAFDDHFDLYEHLQMNTLVEDSKTEVPVGWLKNPVANWMADAGWQDHRANSIDEQDRCVVCLDAAPTHAVVPCGHQCLCGECAEQIMYNAGRCPICRTTAIISLRIYK